MSMIAVGDPGQLMSLPDMYMRKMAVGPRREARSICCGRSSRTRGDRGGVRPARGRVTRIILDRPRHHDLIEEIRDAGARIKLIQDGDVTASISAAIRGTNDHLAIGIGGTRQAVLSRRRSAVSAASSRAVLATSSREIDASARAASRLRRIFQTKIRPRGR